MKRCLCEIYYFKGIFALIPTHSAFLTNDLSAAIGMHQLSYQCS